MKEWSTKGGIKVTRVLSGRSSVFLVSGNNLNLLVDTSPGNYRRKLDARLKRLGISNISYLVITHAHYDHAANASHIREKYRAKVLIHSADAGFLETGENVLPRGTNQFIDPFAVGVRKIFKKLASYKPCKYDIEIESFYDFSNEGLDARIIHTPGHTPGSVSLIAGNEIALAGDALFGVFRNRIMPPFGNDVNDIVKSWGILLETGCRLYMPAHGSERTRECVEMNFRKFSERIQARHV